MSAEQDSTIINLLSNVKIALQFADGNWITFQTGGVELTTFTVGYSGVTFNDILTASPFNIGSNLVWYRLIDSLGQQDNTECITYLVGTSVPKFICTSYVNGIVHQQPIIIGTLLTTPVVGVVSSIVLFFSKVAQSSL
ncbi:unnamed protein product [Rotaria sordida]|uniref:Uncharacterized protein n=1 Tax=Rotaria sordida TaxID=392033 RepID=A0A819FYV9_9BILA|nr:unnamed protein product [Rotaria sordida]CAF1375518.1 unnamed protein product [Rotaria sordida]CAF1406990.1 unnamed protein product [Rotaria sordida]CAF3853256.1 unnamed protein product [Rotaria sordida]CAF3874925.1 unnamed protein product [Rotaria sordida]